MKRCPHCRATLVAHGGINEGFFHCNQCGCCFDGDSNLRENTLPCTPVSNVAASQDQTQLQERISTLEAQLAEHPAVKQVSELEEVNSKLTARITELEAAAAKPATPEKDASTLTGGGSEKK